MSRGGGLQVPVGIALTAVAFIWLVCCPSQARAQAVLAPNPSGVNFGNQRVDVESEPVAISIANIGDTTATDILCILVNRPPFSNTSDPLAFSISGCPTTLSVGASFEMDISFTAYIAGPIGATLAIVYESGDGSDSDYVDLDGSGIDGPDLVVNSNWSDIEIGQQHINAGPTTPAVQVPMENPHPSSDLTITAFQLVGTSCSDFNFGFPMTPLTISASTTDFFSVTFNPSDFGIQICEISFVSDDPDVPDTIAVIGTGINQAILVTPWGYDFGAVDASADAVIRDFDIANDGDLGDLSITSVNLSGATCGAFILSGVPVTPFDISPGSFEMIAAAFDPPAPGGYECSIEIHSNDPGAMTINISLVGTGIGVDWIFSDGFENGTTDNWSAVTP